MAGIEVNTCGWTNAPQFDLGELLRNRSARNTYREAFESRGLEIICLNANRNFKRNKTESSVRKSLN